MCYMQSMGLQRVGHHHHKNFAWEIFVVESKREVPFGFRLMHCREKQAEPEEKDDLENASTLGMHRNGRQCFGIPGPWRGRLNQF